MPRRSKYPWREWVQDGKTLRFGIAVGYWDDSWDENFDYVFDAINSTIPLLPSGLLDTAVFSKKFYNAAARSGIPDLKAYISSAPNQMLVHFSTTPPANMPDVNDWKMNEKH